MMCVMRGRCAVALNAKDGRCNDMLYCFGDCAGKFMKQNLTMKNLIDTIQPSLNIREQ